LKCLLSELKLKRIAAQLRLSLDVRMGGGGFKGGGARLFLRSALRLPEKASR
jgi:hypothetical protein